MPEKSGPRANESIEAAEVRLIDETGENVGVVKTRDAVQRAAQAGLDLVEISPGAKPPVAKIMDLGKYKYELQKKQNEARKKQKTIEVKELKFRPNIDEHDYQVKMKNMHKFIDAGDKVKVTLRFRGREMAHQELGMEVLNRVREEMGDKVKVEAKPNMEGRQMVMVLAPEASK
ncbi:MULTISPECIES: translation initiation factor IF-3 [Curvivirga]|uniref:translation initiation factor IF-3 n=1 Tax=Curvivirga TaxID=2856846 RepID=UPI0012BB7C2C|nr:translation initiation factor IF-3 [Curvivirga aplysinae]MTI09896.1 translation initiation factor IF-3 [Curvivirga aplysinae]